MNKTKRRSRKKKSIKKKRRNLSKVLSIPSFTFATENKALKIKNRHIRQLFTKNDAFKNIYTT